MKRLFWILPILTLFVLAACEDSFSEESNTPTDNQPSTEIPDGYIRLSLHTDINRTSYAGGGKIAWSNGDKIVVNNTTCTVNIDGEEAFVYAPPADSYEAFYPAEIRTLADVMMLQPAQSYSPDSFGAKANPMYGTGDAESGITLRSVCGVAKLNLKGSATISSIAITDKSGGALCGKFDYRDGVATIRPSSVVQSSVVLNCTNVGGVKLTPTGTDFYIVLPAGEYPAGWKLSISDTSGRAMVIDSTTPRSVKVNDILSLPAIDYSPDEDLLFAEYFDKNVWGIDAYKKSKGFANPAGLNATGYELSTAELSNSASNVYGSPAISTVWDTPQTNQMSSSYIKSRSLEKWLMLFQCREVYGALNVGHPTDHRGILRLPKLENIAKGEVCKIQLTFKVAFLGGASCDPLMVFANSAGGPGVPIAYYLDGKEIDIPKNSKYWTSSQNVQPIPLLPTSTMCNERLLINHPDNNEIKDAKWHTIRVDFGAVTSQTTLQLQSYSAHTPLSEFVIDDIEIRKVAYPFQEDAEHYVVSKGEVKEPSKLMLPLSITISTGGSWMSCIQQFTSTGVEYIDIGLGYSTFFDVTKTQDGYGVFISSCADAMRELKAKFDAAGLKIWHIHLPGIGSKYTKQSNGTYAAKDNSNPVDFANTDNSIRQDAVNRMKQIIEAVKPLEAEYLLIHPSGYNDGGPEDKYYFTSARKAALVASLKELVPAAQNAGSTLVIENLGNYKSAATSLTIKPEYINYFASQVPGLKFCFDFSHGTVDNINDGAQFIRDLDPDILKVLHVHGGGNDRDVHLIPGYSGTYKFHDHLNWGEIYTELIKYGYRGPFTYEPGSYDSDCNASYSNIIHNYYEYVYPEYRKAQ